MITFKKYLVYVLVLLCAPAASFGQAIADIFDCRSVRAQITDVSDFVSGDQQHLFSIKLERELIEGVWTTIRTEKSQKTRIIFEDLVDGLYRVTFIVKYEKSLAKAVLHNQNLTEQIQAPTNLFLSNSVRISTSNEDCSAQQISGEKLESLEVYIFPNPSTGNLSIRKSSATVLTVEIYALTGRILQSFTMDSHQRSKTIELPKAGLYLVRWRNPHGLAQTRKVSILQ